MNQINPKKLKLSNWTAVNPKNKEKHFIVSKVVLDEENNVSLCLIEAVMSNKESSIDWKALKNSDHWKQGWV